MFFATFLICGIRKGLLKDVVSYGSTLPFKNLIIVWTVDILFEYAKCTCNR